MGLLSDTTDEKIARKINTYIDAAHARTGKTGPGLIDAAFTDIQHDRQAQCASDVVTVSAEHYLFARLIVAENPHYLPIAGLVSLVVSGYDLAKILGVKKQVTDCPTSAYSRKHTRWKIHGVSHGMWDAINTSGPPRKVKPTGGMEGVTVI